MDKIAVTVEEACELCSIGRASMAKLMLDPRFPLFKVGNKNLIPVAGLIKYFEILGKNREGLI